MNALIIKDPADLLSFIGHTLGFWPQESLVCITLNKDKVGATLRIALPRQPGLEVHFARTVAAYLTSDERANGIVFALYTTEIPEPGEARSRRATIAALTGVLAHEGITIRDGIYVTGTTYCPYDTMPGNDIAIPISSTEYSQVNAEFIDRGSTIEPTNHVALPLATHKQEHSTAVEHHKQTSPAGRQRMPLKTPTACGPPCWRPRTIPPSRTSCSSSPTTNSRTSATGSWPTSQASTNHPNTSSSP